LLRLLNKFASSLTAFAPRNDGYWYFFLRPCANNKKLINVIASETALRNVSSEATLLSQKTAANDEATLYAIALIHRFRSVFRSLPPGLTRQCLLL
jgi:hypothetical protein